jgi:hypothetical protein
MGGPGSGNWVGHLCPKTCAESCDAIDLAFLKRQGWLEPGGFRSGPLRWTVGGQVRSEITCVVDLTDESDPLMRLKYTYNGEPIAYSVRLTTTAPNYGGARWWFLCPLTARGVRCWRRVRKLYRVGRYFGCRNCHDLTYRSRQEHDARVSRLMKSPGQIAALLNSKDTGNLLLALKAGLALERRGDLG